MNCPICERAVEEQEPYFPFCSERCKLIDLGRWASEGYVVSTPLEPERDRKPAPPADSGEQ